MSKLGWMVSISFVRAHGLGWRWGWGIGGFFAHQIPEELPVFTHMCVCVCEQDMGPPPPPPPPFPHPHLPQQQQQQQHQQHPQQQQPLVARKVHICSHSYSRQTLLTLLKVL